MAFEIYILIIAALIQLSLIMLHGTYIALTFGILWGTGKRDKRVIVPDMGRRIERSLVNNMENMAVFLPLIIAIAIGNLLTPTIQLIAITYIALRLAFTLIYIANIPYIRTAVWLAGQLCILLIIYVCFKG